MLDDLLDTLYVVTIVVAVTTPVGVTIWAFLVRITGGWQFSSRRWTDARVRYRAWWSDEDPPKAICYGVLLTPTRHTIPIRPIPAGGTQIPNPAHALAIDAALQRYYLAPGGVEGWWRARKAADEIYTVLRHVGALGLIGDLTDPLTSTRWVIWSLTAFKLNLGIGPYIPLPDLTLSDFPAGRVVFRLVGVDGMKIAKWLENFEFIAASWGCLITIRTLPGLPEAICVEPIPELGEHLRPIERVDSKVLIVGHNIFARQIIVIPATGSMCHMLVLGQSRWGKSTLLRHLIWQLLHMQDDLIDEVWYWDPTGATGFDYLEEAGCFLFRSPDDWPAFVAKVEGKLKERRAIMRIRKWVEWRGPRCVLIIDELAQSAKLSPAHWKQISAWITTVGRCGIWFWSATPHATEAEGVPSAVKTNSPIKVMFGVNQDHQAFGFYNCDKTRFADGIMPTMLQVGQCVIEYPGNRKLFYVKCEDPDLDRVQEVDTDEKLIEGEIIDAAEKNGHDTSNIAAAGRVAGEIGRLAGDNARAGKEDRSDQVRPN